MTTSKFAALALVVLGGACAEMGPEAVPVPPDPATLTRDVETLAERVGGGSEVSGAEFSQTLAPFETASFDRWPEAQLEQLVSSFQRLRTSLVTRYRIVDPVCTDDSYVRYSLCQTGYPCVASVQLAELHCLWFVAH